MTSSLARRAVAEFVGTAFLLAAVVGSGIMGERLAGGNVAIALLANTVATGAALVALILAFGPISGAHFNPAVTLADASLGGLGWHQVPAYLVAQVAGAFSGVAAAHAMFGAPVFRLHITYAAEALRFSVSSLLPRACFALSGDASGFAAPPCPLLWEHTSRLHTGLPLPLPSRILRLHLPAPRQILSSDGCTRL